MADCGDSTYNKYSAGRRNKTGAGPFTESLPNPFSDTVPRTVETPCPGRASWNSSIGDQVCEYADALAWLETTQRAIGQLEDYVAVLELEGLDVDRDALERFAGAAALTEQIAFWLPELRGFQSINAATTTGPFVLAFTDAYVANFGISPPMHDGEDAPSFEAVTQLVLYCLRTIACALEDIRRQAADQGLGQVPSPVPPPIPRPVTRNTKLKVGLGLGLIAVLVGLFIGRR